MSSASTYRAAAVPPTRIWLNEDARRIDALYHMTDRLYHAQSLEDVYNAALQAILTGLNCDRASILLFDEQQVMRFVAWHGLPESYRRLVEGHSPWTAADRNPAPVCVADFEAADIAPTLKQTVLDEGIRAAAFVPLCAGGRLIGKFMTYYDAPHAFAGDEIELCLNIARQLAFAIQQRRTDEALAHQRRLYEAILTNTPDLAYVFDLQHRFIYANEGLLKTWGKSLEETVGRTCLELGYEPWHARMHDHEIDQVVATGKPVRGEVPFVGTQGRRFYDYLFVPVFGAEGRVVAVAGTTRDVTEIRDADRRKDEFLAMLAHELRNPLAPITGAIALLRREQGGTPLRQEACAIIGRQTAQLTRLVDDLLDVARITTGRIQLRREWVQLADIVDSAVQSVRALVEQQAHELVVTLPEDAVWLRADAARVQQVLVNLLNNAAKYTPRGGRIELDVAWNGEIAVLTVRDNGVGIEPQLLPRIFERFTQAERSLHRSSGGLGLGLSLVRDLVTLHGGQVQARSELGKGSEFVVQLPASREHARQSA
jgi:PAS domain S-box-containing protein